MRPALIKRRGCAIFPEIQRWRSVAGALLKPLSGKGESRAVTREMSPVRAQSGGDVRQEIFLGVETRR
jgi:hypothetical protein